STKVFENVRILVFCVLGLVAPVHVRIIPTKCIASMKDVAPEDLPLIGEIHAVAQQIAVELGIADSGYRLINNCGPDSGQAVPHLHYHLLGGAKLGALVGSSTSHA
ncbi:HIT family hydrolase, partial [Paenibacillus riograndensis]